MYTRRPQGIGHPKLQGERDDERFQAVLDNPSLADPDRADDETREPPRPVARPQPAPA